MTVRGPSGKLHPKVLDQVARTIQDLELDTIRGRSPRHADLGRVGVQDGVRARLGHGYQEIAGHLGREAIPFRECPDELPHLVQGRRVSPERAADGCGHFGFR